MKKSMLDDTGKQLEADARSWIEQEKPRELLYGDEQLDLAKEWVRQNAVSREAWEFFEASMINGLRRFAIGWLVASGSTEIRTPLTSIKGHSDILLTEHLGPLNPEQIRFLEIIKVNAERLSSIFNYAQEEAEKFDGRQHPDQ